MLKYSHPTLAWILDYWPIMIFAPTVLLIIAALALITRWWDRRDEAARESVRSPAPAPDVVVTWQAGRRQSPSPKPRSPLAGSTAPW
jgi:hypothetical protein